MIALFYRTRMDKIGIIILAAGNSSRLGRPKQLLPFAGKTLLTHIVDEALEAALKPVVVVTGAYATEVSDSLRRHQDDRSATEPVIIAHNPHWSEGMASGIVTGLTKLLSTKPDLEGAIIAVCDQPHLSASLLKQLTTQFNVSGKGMVASRYAATPGTPVLFGSRYFPALLGLSGTEGAKKLLKAYPDDVAMVEFPGGEIDIDTEEDTRNILPGGSNNG